MKLAVRLSALAVGQLAVLAAVAVYIASLTRPAPDPSIERRLDDAVARVQAGAPAAEVAAELELQLYGRGVSPEPRRRREPREPHASPRRREGPPFRLQERRLPDGRVFVAPFVPPPPWLGPLLTLLAGVFVFGVGGVLTARWIVRPLDELRRAAREVGEGKLDARAGLTRRDELGEVARAFDEMVARLAAQLQAERELLANVSHELRTPLARIRVAVDLANEGDTDAARESRSGTSEAAPRGSATTTARSRTAIRCCSAARSRTSSRTRTPTRAIRRARST